MAKFLPLFPLRLVAFPGEILNLHIFEPRYKELITDVRESGKTFGIPAYIKDRVADYGTEMELLSIEKTYESGEMDVKAKGIGIFHILEFLKDVPDKLYPAGVVSSLQFEPDKPLKEPLVKAITDLYQLLGVTKDFGDELNKLFAFDVAHYVGLSLEQSYQLLSLKSEEERQNMLLLHLRKLLPVLQKAEELKSKIRMNGHFRNEIPPEI